MSPSQYSDRIKFHDALELMEVDFSNLTFTNSSMVNEFYDAIDGMPETRKGRWYFMVNYHGCAIAPDVWETFAARGKKSNEAFGKGTVRIGATEETRDTIRTRAQDDQFRANLYETREEALVALGEMRKRQQGPGDAAAQDAILKISDINLQFGGIHALQGVGFEVRESEVFAIIGPNGAGKTSMLNVISGFYKPNRGQILFQGKDRTHLPPHEVAKLGFARTFQNIALFKGMSTLDNLMTGRLLKTNSNMLKDAVFWGPGQKEEIRHREHVERIIDFLEIQAIRRTPVGKLPYGLQKRVELGRALAMEPTVLLLDEPMAGMNLEEKEDMSRFILDVNDEWGTTMILIEHDMGVVMDISEHIVVLDYGKKIGDGTPYDVRSNQAVINAYLGVTHD